MFGLMRLDHVQQLLCLSGLSKAHHKAERKPVISRFEQIGMRILGRFDQDLAHRTDQSVAVAGPLVVDRSFHVNRVNWLPPPRGGGRVVECERLLSA